MLAFTLYRRHKILFHAFHSFPTLSKSSDKLFRNICHSPYLYENKNYKLFNRIKRVNFINIQFHTSPPLCIPPGLALIIRPLTRITAFLFGRLFKRWWAKKTPEEKQKLKKWFTSKRQKIYGSLGVFMFMLTLFYVINIEKEPLTGRSRFIILNSDQQNVLGKFMFDVHLNTHQQSLVPVTHPAHVRLSKITDRLLKANEELPQIQQRKWTLSVIDSDEMNAYVLPGGNIFVFLGALRMSQNDDQLATILAHEIAHVLLVHPIEQISRNFIQDMLLAVPITLIWAMFPDLLAFILQAVGINILNIFMTLPYSRKLETEADDIGLILAAKACFDIRETVVFWRLMQKLIDTNTTFKIIPWLSTHPNHEDREKYLKTKLPEALIIRTKSGKYHRTRNSPFRAVRKCAPSKNGESINLCLKNALFIKLYYSKTTKSPEIIESQVLQLENRLHPLELNIYIFLEYTLYFLQISKIIVDYWKYKQIKFKDSKRQ